MRSIRFVDAAFHSTFFHHGHQVDLNNLAWSTSTIRKYPKNQSVERVEANWHKCCLVASSPGKGNLGSLTQFKRRSWFCEGEITATVESLFTYSVRFPNHICS